MQGPVPFDPAKGCQKLSTGMLGAFFILGLSVCYILFKTSILPGGGPQVFFPFFWLPSSFRFPWINRDYYDVIMIVLLGFQFMVHWELLRDRRLQTLTLATAIVSLGLCWKVAHGWAWPLTVKATFLDITLTDAEITLSLTCLAFLIIGFIPLIRFLRSGKRPRISPWTWALRTALFRWLAGLVAFSLVLLFTFQHPFYRNGYYENWRITCSGLYTAYLFLGLPYAFLTNLFRGHRFEDRSDPCFVLLMIFHQAWRALCRGDGQLLWNTVRHRRTLIVLRDLLVKIFYLPLMTSFLFVEFGGLSQVLPVLFQKGHQILTAPKEVFDLFYYAAYRAIFVMDVSLALLGYATASRWLGNKSKSVEPTLFGWVVTLACYPPFNGVSDNYLPYGFMQGQPIAFFQDPTVDIVLKCVTLSMFAIYVWATMSFGLRFSNLTHRGIITRGPYARIRHPAYAAKNIAWWTENLRILSTPWQALFLLGWNAMYYLRAVTEERHLRRDPDYAAYCEKVRYKFIPGVW